MIVPTLPTTQVFRPNFNPFIGGCMIRFSCTFKLYLIIHVFAYARLLTYILNNLVESRGFWINFRSKVTEARTPWALNLELISFKDRKVYVPQSANYSEKVLMNVLKGNIYSCTVALMVTVRGHDLWGRVRRQTERSTRTWLQTIKLNHLDNML